VNAILVLGGDVDTRPLVAAALFKQGLARQILLPGVKSSVTAVTGLQPPEQEIMRQILRLRGVPEQAIVQMPGEVTNTRDEAVALRRFLGPESRSSVAVVTNGYHTRRARAIFRKVFAGSGVDLHFIAAPTDGFDAHNWWHFERGWTTYLTEFVKFLVLS
jgi:uncharacterized SAM-binding protein YcdF (DUF218 family)